MWRSGRLDISTVADRRGWRGLKPADNPRRILRSKSLHHCGRNKAWSLLNSLSWCATSPFLRHMLTNDMRRHLRRHCCLPVHGGPSLSSPIGDCVGVRLSIQLSSRTNVRDLRFLPALEMTEEQQTSHFSIATKPLEAKEKNLRSRLCSSRSRARRRSPNPRW